MNPAFQEIALQVLSDPDFARRLLDKPEETLRSVGIEPTAEVLQIIASLDKDAMLNMADSFTDEHKAM